MNATASATAEFDGCQVLRKISAGTVTDLYEAMQLPLGRRVLVKALSASMLPSSPFAASLEREARLLAELDHPNILRVHEFERRDDRMWLVLEHVDGWTLQELLETRPRLPPLLIVAVGVSVARALEHAHGKGIVHRDVRPANVAIGRDGSVKLAHFAVAVNERLPSLPELLDGASGSSRIAYMSPEQILGEQPDPRSDLFSLGITMYRALTGVWPFGDGSEPATHQIRHQSPAPLGRLVSEVPGSLERAVHRCLQKVPADRFSSAAELAQALCAVLTELGQPSSRLAASRALEQAGLVEQTAESDAAPMSIVPPRETQASAFRTTVLGLASACAMIVLGGTLVFALAGGSDLHASSRAGTGRLDLVPVGAGQLRVVADPWARVIVDGHEIDTTPFARSIPLRAGTHYVRLEHPQAPPERRTIHLVPGETVLLDVKMKVVRPQH
jgi:serine/threonine protein kinase